MIKVSKNLEIIKYVVYQRDILNNVLEDGVTIDTLRPELFFSGGFWLEFHDNGELVGVIHCVPCARYALEMHFYVLPWKKEAKYRMWNEFLKYIATNEDLKELKKINVCIPECYQNIIHLVIKIGFVQEGIDRMSFKKNGAMIDRFRFGMTRDEINNEAGKCLI
jgi:hypothetical protein